jgi:Helix-turn-helix.
MTPAELKAARLALGLTLDEMAEMLGYDGRYKRAQLHRMEIGERPIMGAQRRLVQAYLHGWRPDDWPRKT